ncbi:CoA ester lyase [Frankia sp. BMG5.23]|uniref:HpcH/HpaI aldolase/citrate lyase family protein n=1 Tax=Frankia sp. BMG5.23 TaxID=683305 RepID=UPI000461C0E7|nr:CoA ester lyase [Frankia sp. BMG5.23]KDA42158.1 citrate lyase beta subunit [Frankia sp. BMG5.23]
MIGQLPGPALLFCPADRPDRFAKAAAAADGVILDLEDGVAAADRPRARRALRESILDPLRTIIRINPAGTADYDEDLRALADTPYPVVMLAKTESAEQVAAVGPRRVVALCETPRGVLAAAEIAAVPTTIGVMWGAEDLVAALGGRSSRDEAGRYRGVALHARASVLLAAGAHGRVAVDSVYLDIADVDGLAAEARDAVASGFAAKACIHPRQVAAVRQAFAPSADEVAWARRVLDAATHSAGVFSFEGRMVDAPVLRHAERTLAATEHDPAVTVTDSPADQRRRQGPTTICG